MRLVLLADPKGVPVGYDLVGPKTGQERDAVLELAAAHPGSTLFADGGFWGARVPGLDGANRHRADHSGQTQGQPAPRGRGRQARIRLIIESVFATLKRQMGLQDHLAKTLPGLVARIAQRLLALTLGIYLNTLLGRRHAPSPPTTDDEPTSSL